MNNTALHKFFLWLATAFAFLGLVACDPTVNIAQQPQETVTINPGFQSQVSPIPTVPPYRCGAWTSNNAPDPSATIFIYARLTHDTIGVIGQQASATVHFQSGDVTPAQTPTSDQGGYVSFTLDLQDRQPSQVPATIDVTFPNLPGGALKCSQAFFTPT
jgi:hypothetical protein